MSGLFCSHPLGIVFLTDALKEVTEMTSQLQHSLIRLENFQKLTELQHDLIGIDNLMAPGRVSTFALVFRALIGFIAREAPFEHATLLCGM